MKLRHVLWIAIAAASGVLLAGAAGLRVARQEEDEPPARMKAEPARQEKGPEEAAGQSEGDNRKEGERAEAEGEKQENHKDDAHGEEGEKRHELKLAPEVQQRLGMKFAEVSEGTLAPSIRAIGRIEEDPHDVFTLRAPLAGVLRAEGDGWPEIGAAVQPQDRFAAVEPRLAPLEAYTLQTQFVEARAAVAELEAERDAAKASYESKRAANLERPVVAERQLDEAEARMKSAEARLAAARQKLELFEQREGTYRAGLPAVPIRLEQGGHVVDVQALAGESVEAGQVLMRVRGDRLIARVELYVDQAWSGDAATVPILQAGDDAAVVEGRVIGRAPQAGPRTHGAAWLISVDAKSGLRPGVPIVALLPLGGEALHGVVIPASAVIRYGGLSWVYVREGEEFERRAVNLLGLSSAGWLVSGDVEAGNSVVTTGAQILLSEELKEQIEAEEEASE